MTGVEVLLRRRRRTRSRWLATAAVVAVAVALAVVVLARSSEPDTPEEAVQAYVDAVQNRDWSASWDLMCESEQRSDGPRASFLAERAERPPLGDDRRIAGEALRIQPFPIEAWRVSALVEGHAGIHTQHLVIRENGRLRVCGDPLYLYEARSGIA